MYTPKPWEELWKDALGKYEEHLESEIDLFLKSAVNSAVMENKQNAVCEIFLTQLPQMANDYIRKAAIRNVVNEYAKGGWAVEYDERKLKFSIKL